MMYLDFFLAKSKFRKIRQECHRLLAVLLICFVVIDTVCAINCSKDSDCLHGTCISGLCDCDDGWTGDRCDHCGGRVRLDSPTGYITDGPGNYKHVHTCTWLIDSGELDSIIRLRFDHFETECCWDYFYVYDGNSIYDPLVAAVSGLLVPETASSNTSIPEVTTSSGYAYLHFYSDAAYIMTGFNISYSVNSCPKDCSNNGNCTEGPKCDCESGWSGDACDIVICPNDCGDHGHCEPATLTCQCTDDYQGYDCLTPPTDGHWELIYDNLNPGRASHASVLQGDVIWIVGGYPFSNNLNYLDILRYNITLGHAEAVLPLSETKPTQRYGHSLVLNKDSLLMYGGTETAEGVDKIVAQLWSFNITTETWHHIETGGHRYAVDGHTAHMVNGVMIIIFGYSPELGYTNIVQEFDSRTGKWTLPSTTGVNVNGAYGHSSSYDSHNDLIYVYGGNKAATKNSYYLSDDLYSYKPSTRHWSVLPSSGHFQYLHSSVSMGGMFYVFGGNPHNDTAASTGAKCYSSNLIAFDLRDCTAFGDEESCILGSPGITCAWNARINKIIQIVWISRNVMNVFWNTAAVGVTVNVLLIALLILFTDNDQCEGNDYPCEKHYSCQQCQLQPECYWSTTLCRIRNEDDQNITCKSPCSEQYDCQACASNGCMWCANSQRCVDSNAYVTSFPYGLCMSWHNNKDTCPEVGCSQYRTCEDCHENPGCGWCDDGSNTGLGVCMEGKENEPVLDNTCPARQWFFIGCPGEQCEECTIGYYGDPTNGGNCSQCFCNGHATECDNKSGNCHCTTKGITGKECDRCDSDNKYYGDPTNNGTCYYELLLNYQFTFNLSKPDDKHITAINFKCTADTGNRDIEFNLNAAKPCILMLTYRSIKFMYTHNTPASNLPIKPLTSATAISIEPCHGGRAAVLSLLMRLPASEGGYAPAGYNGLIVGSAIVQVNPKKGSEGKDKNTSRQRKGHPHRPVPNGTNCV
uniref:Attractin-like n=1 Tax=Saccoglossus kowalevskii TaxID=10224 RepID=A0ABM0N116_SACKO|nr:PREDICTED: attractin-like [Saccoglossus kowalevskii]